MGEMWKWWSGEREGGRGAAKKGKTHENGDVEMVEMGGGGKRGSSPGRGQKMFCPLPPFRPWAKATICPLSKQKSYFPPIKPALDPPLGRAGPPA